MSRNTALTTRDLYALRLAVRSLLVPVFGEFSTYLVGTAASEGQYRDVDVRTIVDDDVFDDMFGSYPELWGAWCFTVGSWLQQQTGLPIDYQVQRRSEANEQPGPRHPLTHRSLYAGGGDATKFVEGDT